MVVHTEKNYIKIMSSIVSSLVFPASPLVGARGEPGNKANSECKNTDEIVS